MENLDISKFKKPKLLLYSDIHRQQEYQPSEIKEKHNGQLKLLLTEIQFFTNCGLDKLNSKDRPIYVLYIGSGRGYHIIKLLEIYKDYNIKWNFYDPSGHCINLESKSQRYNVNKCCFTDKNINEYINKSPLIFISDIRTTDGSEPTSKNLINDYNIQNKIVLTLKPEYSLLKFRYLFPDDFPDTTCYYVDGIQYLQSYAGQSSTELRTFVPKEAIILNTFTKDKAIEYEQKMYYYNKVYRKTYKNDILIAGYILNKANLYLNMKYKDVIKILEKSIIAEIIADDKFNKRKYK